jgi:ornithine cyclodeaminase/alanine dehydrogenase-like protein (mu-crystallin family)
MGLLLLDHADVLAALDPDLCRGAMEEALVARARGEALMPLRSVIVPPGGAGAMAAMPAWRGATASAPEAFALKAVCVMPGNPARGLDGHQGLVALFDGTTGVPRALLDGSAVTAVRTAAVSAVATDRLAREDARELAILGAGVQAGTHLDAVGRVRAFSRVRVFAPTRAHVDALLASRAGGPAELVAAPSAEEAVRGADVVVCATTAREPVLRRAWLAPGAHVNAVGASQPTHRELDVDTVAAAELFADSRESVAHEAGEFRDAVAAGAIGGIEDVRAELGEVLTGEHPGRTDPAALTVFRSLGLAVEDLGAAQAAVAAARERGLGREVAW